MDKVVMERIQVTQVRSLIKRPKSQKATIKALGLGRINKRVVVEATPQVLGMVAKVNHLVVTEKI